MKLSPHFTLEELIATQVRDVDNRPPLQVEKNLYELAQRMEEVRTLLKDKPILVNSGYRSALVNKIVGGSITSAHMRGWAIDFIAPGFGTPFECCEAIEGSPISFDQLIFEETWVHLSFAPALRREVLTKRKHGSYINGLRKGEND